MEKLNKIYDEMQQKFGEKSLNSIYGGGSLNPDIVLVFMNPTQRNISADKSWTGIKRAWLGTKQVWKFLNSLELFSSELNDKIQKIKPCDWTLEFCEEVYNEVKNKKLWITNLAKCTQSDARPLPDSVFLSYRELLIEELSLLKPKKVILFGNQVSSIVLEEKIKVSECRKMNFQKKFNNIDFNFYCVYYPVGNGSFNKDKAVEDIKWILTQKEEL